MDSIPTININEIIRKLCMNLSNNKEKKKLDVLYETRSAGQYLPKVENCSNSSGNASLLTKSRRNV